ncbi:MAG: hypothetical protein AAF720_02190 [Pseudomonadota bacterium]
MMSKSLLGKATEGKTLVTKIAVVIFSMLLVSCAQELEETPYFDISECRRIDLVNGQTGESIVGAEDFAIDTLRDRLIISAYDRRRVENAAGKGAQSIPQGGVFSVSFSDLITTGQRRLAVEPLIQPSSISGGLRPHGISYQAATDEIIFINRAYERRSSKKSSWQRVTRLEKVGGDGAIFMGDEKPIHCAANDVFSDDGQIWLSHDHSFCGWRAAFEDVFGLKKSGILTLSEKPSDLPHSVASNIQFANGLTQIDDITYALAATREAQIVFYQKSENDFIEKSRFDVPGGPDNFLMTTEGTLTVAVHPSLMAMGLHRKLGIGTAPSRIVDVNYTKGTYRLLFDDVAGKLWSGATVAYAKDNWLAIGSATDEGILLCQKPYGNQSMGYSRS